MKLLPLDPAKLKPIPAEPGFGDSFSNRMFVQDYHVDRGWYDAQICQYGPFSLDPASAVLHYGQEIFEGTKGYLRPDGNINLFRPMENMLRFNKSAERMGMPVVDPEFHLEAIKQLVALEHEWVPSKPGQSLYIRPFMFATRPALGVVSSDQYKHVVIVGPVGSYFRAGFNTIGVHISDTYRRAVKGGVGFAKTGGNYAASLMVGAQAKEKGYSQVLWLDAIEGRYIEEVGAMNMMFVMDRKKLVTPALSGTILDGVTRKSVIHMARDMGYEVEEGQLDVHEILAGMEAGSVTEAFGVGTAAVIAPVGRFGYKDKEYVVGGDEVGPVATELYDRLTGIQRGLLEDPFGWTVVVEPVREEMPV